MADFIYACDQIRRNLNPDISGFTGITGRHGVAPLRDAWSVVAL